MKERTATVPSIRTFYQLELQSRDSCDTLQRRRVVMKRISLTQVLALAASLILVSLVVPVNHSSLVLSQQISMLSTDGPGPGDST